VANNYEDIVRCRTLAWEVRQDSPISHKEGYISWRPTPPQIFLIYEHTSSSMHGSLLKAMIDCHAGILLESLVLTGMASGQYSRKSSHGHVRQSENVMLKMILWTDILTTSHRVCMCVKGAMARWTLTTHEWMKRTGKCVRWRTRESLSSATCTRYHLIFFYTYRSNPCTCYCHYKQLYDVDV